MASEQSYTGDAASQLSSSPRGAERDQDVLVSRLVARIAELEERLFKTELDAPIVRNEPSTTPSRAPDSDPHARAFLSLWPSSTRAPPGTKGAAGSGGGGGQKAPSPMPSPSPAEAAARPRLSATGLSDPTVPSTPALRTTPSSIASISGRGGGAGEPSPSPAASSRGVPSFGHSAASAAAFAAMAALPPAGPFPGGTPDLKNAASEWLSKMKFSWGGAKDNGAAAKDAAAEALAPGSGGRAAEAMWGAARGGPSRTPSASIHGGSTHGEEVVQMTGFNEKAFEMQLEALGTEAPSPAERRAPQTSGSYFRYVFDPADVEAEMEVTARVRRAAAEALMEANEKLAEAAGKLSAAEERQEALTRQLEEARELDKVVEQLKAEHAATLAAKRGLEDDALAASAQLDRTRAAADAATAEVEGLREAAQIWRDGRSSEQDKLRQENALIRSQLTTRLNELQAAKTRLADTEADKQRVMREQDGLQSQVKWLTTVNLQLEAAAEQLESHRKASAEFQDKFMRERNVRRKLHEQLQQLKGNIRVMCRVRPSQDGLRSIVSSPLEGLLAVAPGDRRPQEFEFDHVFCGETTQAEVFEEVSPLVRSCADGFNVCIFAFGQTGSGKTHTMEGPPSDPGINVRCITELFRIAAEEGQLAASASAASGASPANGASAATAAASISVSLVEIYNESVLDLLRPAGSGTDGSSGRRELEVVGLGPGELAPGQDRVVDLTWRPVSNTNEVKQVLREGWRGRSTAATALNEHSSRSHALLTVKASFRHADGRQRCSTIHLVDLAGSERVDKSEVTGQQLKEAQSINKSLSALGDVISALQRRSPHIPFRNSKLTQVLQDSLCGSSKVMLVCNISPEGASSSETISSLNFASRAAQVELGQAKKAMERITSADRLASGSPDRPPPAAAGAGPGSASGNGQDGGGSATRLGVASVTRLSNGSTASRQMGRPPAKAP